MTDDTELRWMIGVTALLLSALFGCILYRGMQHARCLELGYPMAQVTWNLETYCIKRVEQTDTVVPLESL